ncbi:hypothetical protein QYF36_016238 [Acer negundo]|nr:hypothetical protein QYF36_016238 [Acer negundo]
MKMTRPEVFPNQHQVLNYIQSYAHHFDLLKYIRFDTKVVGIEHEEGLSDKEIRSWSLWNGNVWGNSVMYQTFQQFPSNKGPEAFRGKVLHSMDDETAAKFVEGKRVTIVGFQKSAMEIAMECSAANGLENPLNIGTSLITFPGECL